jgi:hypothetical protein
VLQAAGDGRAAGILREAHTRLQAMAAKLPGEARRRAFLESYPERLEIVAAFAREEGSSG